MPGLRGRAASTSVCLDRLRGGPKTSLGAEAGLISPSLLVVWR